MQPFGVIRILNIAVYLLSSLAQCHEVGSLDAVGLTAAFSSKLGELMRGVTFRRRQGIE